jgi:hypothetical protein
MAARVESDPRFSAFRSDFRHSGDGSIGRSDLPFDIRSDQPKSRLIATDKRDELDLQISLLAEHELTRLIEMVSAIAGKLEVRTGAESEVAEITKDIAPETLLSEIEQQNRKR